MNNLELIAKQVVAYVYGEYQEKGGRYLVDDNSLHDQIALAGFTNQLRELLEPGKNQELNELRDRIQANWKLLMAYINKIDASKDGVATES